MYRIVTSRLSCLARLCLPSLAALVLLLAGGCQAPQRREPAAAPEPLLTETQRELNLRSFDHVWTTVRDKHWDPNLGGLDWNAVREELRPRVEAARTTSEARSVLRETVARLGQSHFAILPAEVYTDLDAEASAGEPGGAASTRPGNRSAEAGLVVRVLDGAAVVTRVRSGSAAEADVLPGWQIVSIRGRPVAPRLERIAEVYRDSRALDYYLAAGVRRQLAGAAGERVPVTFLDEWGGERTVELELTEPAGRKVRFGNLPEMRLEFESRWIEPNIGYIRFNVFFDPANLMMEFGRAMESMLDADGIILDLRGNPGGLGAMAMGMAGWFIDEPRHELGVMKLRETELRFVVTHRARAYHGPLAILVDGLTGSTAEIFAGGLKDIGRARIFGTPTIAQALPSTIERLPNGDGFQYAFADYVSAGGTRLEGNGVMPDEQVRLTREALLAGHDPVIDAAVRWICPDAQSGESGEQPEPSRDREEAG
jgi:carboxyl-terminal processing protease